MNEKEILAQLDILNSLFERGLKDVHVTIKSPNYIYRDVINPLIKELENKLKQLA